MRAPQVAPISLVPPPLHRQNAFRMTLHVKALVPAALLIAACAWLVYAVVHSSAVAPDPTPIVDTTICEIATNPERYDGRRF